jgi:hypothetical protein
VIDAVEHKRKGFSLAEKLAASLLMLRDGNGNLVIDPERAKTMTAKEVIACFDFDHTIPVAIGGTNAPWNVVPRLRADHRHKTAKRDIPQIAKTKRLARANDEHVNRLLRKTSIKPDKQPDSAERKRDWFESSRAVTKPDKPKWARRPLQSKPFQKGHRPMRGTR